MEVLLLMLSTPLVAQLCQADNREPSAIWGRFRCSLTSAVTLSETGQTLNPHVENVSRYAAWMTHPADRRPLNYFASLYRQVQKNMMNMDQMLEMLEIEPSVKVSSPDPGEPCALTSNKYLPEALSRHVDSRSPLQDLPDAKEFVCSSNCTLEFENVSFGYSPEAPVLRGVSFKLEGGKTLALVGATGSGKSTALRLIFR